MSPDILFQLSSPLALVGWAALLAAPLAPGLADRVAGLAIPLLLSTAYAALILAFWWNAPGGFDSLGSVQALFANPWIALAGWLHYLAFDLLVGAWEVRIARRESFPHLLLVPCLALTFLFGPAGYLVFQGLRLSRRATPPMQAAR